MKCLKKDSKLSKKEQKLKQKNTTKSNHNRINHWKQRMPEMLNKCVEERRNGKEGREKESGREWTKTMSPGTHTHWTNIHSKEIPTGENEQGSETCLVK